MSLRWRHCGAAGGSYEPPHCDHRQQRRNADIRRRLGVDTGDKVAFVFTDVDRVELRPARCTVAELKGIAPALPDRETIDVEELIAEAFDERTEPFELT